MTAVVTSRGSTRRATRYVVAPALAAALLAGAWSVPEAGAASARVPISVGDDASTTTAPEGGAAATTGAPDDASTTTRAPSTAADVRPRIATPAAPLGQVTGGAVPDADALSEDVADELDSQWLGPSNRRAVTVRDALTGEVLLDRNATRLVTPASTTKLLSAAAIVTGLDGGDTFTTRVVRGPEPGEVVIVAGGDMLLADGVGDPDAVAGHAGLADLAAQTAASLTGVAGEGDDEGDGASTTAEDAEDAAATSAPEAADGAVDGPITVSLDLSYAAGPDALETWTDQWVSEGWTGRVVQLGRSGDRALPFNPSPADPEQEVARVFREALAEEGLDVVGSGDEDATAAEVEAPDDATELASVESAAARDVLALALATSDNAMVEQLARQAAVADGESADQDTVMAWIEQTLVEDYGLDLEGVQIADASGLSDGTRIPVDVVADVLVAGSDGSHPGLQEVLAAGGLPIAGYTGTLSARFHLDVHDPAVGNARAKTGSLPGVTSLAGTVVTEDGRLLAYAMTADDIEDGAAVFEARSVLDEVVAELARCGC